jgi:hypothetical protein
VEESDASDDEDEDDDDDDTSSLTKTIRNIDTVIFCTGYGYNLHMIHPTLRPPYYDYEQQRYNPEYYFQMPKGWKMKPNVLSDELGHVEPYKEIYPAEASLIPGLYQGCYLINNPNMIYITVMGSYPLLEIDIKSYMIVKSLLMEIRCKDSTATKQRQQQQHLFPPFIDATKMTRLNAQEILQDMDCQYVRYKIDENYSRATHERLGGSHWFNVSYASEGYRPLDRQDILVYMNKMNNIMVDAGYPIKFFDIDEVENDDAQGNIVLGIDVHDDDEVSSKITGIGRRFYDNAKSDWITRVDMVEEEKGWMTFRDVDPTKFVSVHTSTKAAPLKKRWIDLHDNDYDDYHLDTEEKTKL